MNSINVGEIDVKYSAMGTGEPIMLLHCTGGSNRQWTQLAEAFCTKFQVIAPDLCGYGDTTCWPGSGPFKLADEAALIAALIDRMGGPMHLVGHSFGGAVALQLARRRPNSLKSLTVIEPAAFHLLVSDDETDAQAFSEISGVAATIGRAMHDGNYVGAMRQFVNYWNGEGAWDALPQQHRAALTARISKVALDFWATLTDPTRLDDFVDLPTNTLVLSGELSPLPARRICFHLAHTLPNVRPQTIEGAGHMLPITHAAEIFPLIVAHSEARLRHEPSRNSDHNLPAEAGNENPRRV